MDFICSVRSNQCHRLSRCVLHLSCVRCEANSLDFRQISISLPLHCKSQAVPFMYTDFFGLKGCFGTDLLKCDCVAEKNRKNASCTETPRQINGRTRHRKRNKGKEEQRRMMRGGGGGG